MPRLTTSISEWVKVTQSCPTLCNPMDCTVHGILQDRILEWVAIPFSRGSSQHRDQTQVSHIAGRFFTSWATKEAMFLSYRKSLPPFYSSSKLFRLKDIFVHHVALISSHWRMAAVESEHLVHLDRILVCSPALPLPASTIRKTQWKPAGKSGLSDTASLCGWGTSGFSSMTQPIFTC